MSIVNAFFVFGLTLDVLGAFYLAQSFITKGLEDLTFEGTSGYGSPPNLRYIRSNLYQKAEAQIGFFLLATGFILQAFDYIYLNKSDSLTIDTYYVLIGVLLISVVGFLLARVVRNKLFTRYARRMAFIVIRESKPENFRNDKWIVTVAHYLLPKLEREPNEDDQSFASRVLLEIGFKYK